MIEIGNIPLDNIPPLGKVVEFHEHDEFALLCRNARVIRSTEIEKRRRPAGHISTHHDAVMAYPVVPGKVLAKFQPHRLRGFAAAQTLNVEEPGTTG